MEQVTGFEPVSSAWQAEILTIILYLHIWSRQQESNLQPTDYKSVALPIAPRRQRKERVRWAVSISRILDGVTQPWIRTTNRGARATELVLRVFHWWGRYCLHLTFNACLRTHGPRYRIRTGPICLEGRDASRWHQSRIWRFLSQPLYKYYITIFKKNQIFACLFFSVFSSGLQRTLS